jgi:hypothetical protein
MKQVHSARGMGRAEEEKIQFTRERRGKGKKTKIPGKKVTEKNDK